MRTTAITAFVLSMILTAPAAAQHTAEVHQVQTLATCISEHHTHLARLVRLLDEAHGRLTSSDAQVRHDAELSITTLLQRAAETRDELRACVDAASFTAPSGETVEHTTPPADDAADHVASSGGSIHEVEADASLGDQVRVVRGERVDGAGGTSDESIRAAVHGAGHAIATCYEQYVDRASARHGSVHVSFTVESSGRITGTQVERGGFDAPMRTCVTRAFSSLGVHGASGRSVYSYEIAFGD